MPYVNAETREQLKHRGPESPGELAYEVWKLLLQYLEKRGDFAAHNDCHGVLTSLSHELYRRRTGPYEEQAIKKNGDVRV